MKSRTFLKFIFTLSVAGAISACSGDVKEQLGLRREGPDEFAVERKPKLEVPPSFKLRPPAPGEDPLNVSTPRDDARRALLGDTTAEPSGETTPETTQADPAASTTSTDPMADLTDSSEKIVEPELEVIDPTKTSTANEAPKQPEPVQEKSEGENALLKNAGTEVKDDNIRSVLRQEYKEEQDAGVLGTLEVISDNNFDKTLVDPAAEKERIQTNKKENKPITEGETPAKSINHDKSVLEKIFN